MLVSAKASARPCDTLDRTHRGFKNMSTPLLRMLRPPGPEPRGYRFGPFTLEIRAGRG